MLVVHFRDEFLSFLCCGTAWFKSNFFIIMLKNKSTCFIYQPIFSHFSGIMAGQSPETDTVVSSDSVSHLIYRVFLLFFLKLFCYWYCTAGSTRPILIVTLIYSKSVTTCSSIFCPLTSSGVQSFFLFSLNPFFRFFFKKQVFVLFENTTK